jgi:hypothetical protein
MPQIGKSFSSLSLPALVFKSHLAHCILTYNLVLSLQTSNTTAFMGNLTLSFLYGQKFSQSLDLDASETKTVNVPLRKAIVRLMGVKS